MISDKWQKLIQAGTLDAATVLTIEENNENKNADDGEKE